MILDEERIRLLGVLSSKTKSHFMQMVSPIIRRKWPISYPSMPIRHGIDYQSVGRKTFLVVDEPHSDGPIDLPSR